MACVFRHNWGWPRRRGDRHIQSCLICGVERESRVQFDSPRYRRTQDPVPNMTVESAVTENNERVTLPSVA
jgi:hypothetical protein